MPDRHADVVGRLAEACRSGDIAAVRAILDTDVIVVCDGGRAVPAPGLAQGVESVAQLASILLCGQPDTELTLESVNGRRGLALRRAGQALAVVGITVAEFKVSVLWIVLNPAKLNGWHRR